MVGDVEPAHRRAKAPARLVHGEQLGDRLARGLAAAVAPAHARVCAANSLLDRGWGKSLQRIASEDGTPLEFLHRIERVIVHPGDPVNDPVIDATIEESVRRVPLSVLGSVGATNDFDVSPEDVWLQSQEQA
nr:hypothetical protein [Bradyrhizobium centrosematis]